MQKNVYIACPIIKADSIDMELLEDLVNYVEEQNFKVFVPGKTRETEPKMVFSRDINWLKQSSIIIAEVSEPSHGVGMEIMYAYEHNIPVVCLVNENKKPISRMISGSSHTLIIEYDSVAELLKLLNEITLKDLKIKKCSKCKKKTIHVENRCKKCDDK
ncbi:MAG: nucleoside 2-deoxyribosyltransferase [Candidatus Heimdallarchaeaceae archaeon]